MAKRGRPRLPENEKRTITRIIVFNEQEDSRLRSLSKNLGISMGAAVRYSVALANDLETEHVSTLTVNDFV